MDDLEKTIEKSNRLEEEIKTIKKVMISAWDNQRDIETQKLIEKFRDDVD